jgi:hypothetical protein
MKRAALLLLTLLGVLGRLVAAHSQKPEEPEANPGRPTVSTPATLTPLGYLQFETGFEGARHSPEFRSRYSFGEAMKVSVSRRLELLASGEPVARFTAEGDSGSRVADIFLGAQGVLRHGEGAKPTVALSYFHRVYDGGAPEFDFGSPTNSFLVLASADLKGFHYDANAFLTELVQESVRRAQFGQSLTISHPFRRRFTVSVRHGASHNHFCAATQLAICGRLATPCEKHWFFDVGLDYGLTHSSTGEAVFAGFTYLLPIVFGPRMQFSGVEVATKHSAK